MPDIGKFLSIALALLTAPGLLAQEKDFPEFKQVSYPFMPALSSEYFYFSSDGLMWFSTHRGLTSFDGSEIVYYSSLEQAEQLRLSNITSLAEDKRGNLFIGTENQVLYFNRSEKKFSAVPLSFPSYITRASVRVKTIYLDDQDHLYIGFSSLGMQVYDLGNKSVRNYDLVSTGGSDCKCDLLQLNTVNTFLPHRTDKDLLWVGTSNGIYLFDKRSKQFSRNFEVENPLVNIYRTTPFYYEVRQMDAPDDSTIWFSTSQSGLGRYSIKTGLVTLFLHNARLNTKTVWKSYVFRSFARWHGDNYFLGVAYPAPGVFNRKDLSFSRIPIFRNYPTEDNIQYTANDRDGNIWVLNRGKLFATIPEHYSFKYVDIHNQTTTNYLPNQLGQIYYDNKSKQYYAAVIFSSGVHVFDSLLRFNKIIPAPLFTNKWTYRESCTEWITMDGSGRIWTSGMETYICDVNSNRFEYAEKLYPQLNWIKTKGESMDIQNTPEGNVLIRFINGDVYHIRHTDMKTDTLKMPQYETISTTEFANKRIIYDSTNKKLYLNNEHTIVQYDFLSQSMRKFDSHTILQDGGTRRISIDHAVDNEGRLWFWIPSFGLKIVEPKQLRCVDSIAVGTNGLLSGNYNYIRFGGPGFIFLIGGEGFVIYNYLKKQSWLFAYNNGIAGPYPYYHGYSNGLLLTNEIDKILYYDLRDFGKINFSKTPVLNTILANDSTVYTRGQAEMGDAARLKFSQNDLRFSFSAQEFFFPERIQYAYQLKGIDMDWHYTHSNVRQVNYTNIPPGKYTFSLKAQMQGGNWNTEPVEYSIVIVPAIWQTKWFRILTVLLIMTLILVFVNRRLRIIREEEKEKIFHEKELLDLEAKALRSQMNPHFIFNSLNSIKSLINKNENDKAARYLTIFSKLIRTLFQNSDRREISLYEEIETCKLYTELEKMRFGDKVDFSFDIDESVDLKDIKVPALILQPFIENAIWHGLVPRDSGGSVKVTVKGKEDTIECTIDDNGIGRELSRQYNVQYNAGHESKGIGLTRSRLEIDKLLNNREDTILITDKVNQFGKPAGTTVVLTFKENDL